MMAFLAICAIFYCLYCGISVACQNSPATNPGLYLNTSEKIQFYKYAYISDFTNRETKCAEACKAIHFESCRYMPKYRLAEPGLRLILDADAYGIPKISEIEFEINPGTNDLSVDYIKTCYCQKNAYEEFEFLAPTKYAALKLQLVMEINNRVISQLAKLLAIYSFIQDELTISLDIQVINNCIKTLSREIQMLKPIAKKIQEGIYITVPYHSIQAILERGEETKEHMVHSLQKTIGKCEEIASHLQRVYVSHRKVDVAKAVSWMLKKPLTEIKQLGVLNARLIQPPYPFTQEDMNKASIGMHSCHHGFVNTTQNGFSTHEVLFFSHLYVNDFVDKKSNCKKTCEDISPLHCESAARPLELSTVRYVEKYEKKLGIFRKLEEKVSVSKLNHTCLCVNRLSRTGRTILNDAQFISEDLLVILKNIEKLLDILHVAVSNNTFICSQLVGACSIHTQAYLNYAIHQIEAQQKKYFRFRRSRRFQLRGFSDGQMYDDFLETRNLLRMPELKLYSHIQDGFESIFHILLYYRNKGSWEYKLIYSTAKNLKNIFILMDHLEELNSRLEDRVRLMKNAYDGSPQTDREYFQC